MVNVYPLLNMCSFSVILSIPYLEVETNRKKFCPLGKTELCFTLERNGPPFKLYIVVVMTKYKIQGQH